LPLAPPAVNTVARDLRLWDGSSFLGYTPDCLLVTPLDRSVRLLAVKQTLLFCQPSRRPYPRPPIVNTWADTPAGRTCTTTTTRDEASNPVPRYALGPCADQDAQLAAVTGRASSCGAKQTGTRCVPRARCRLPSKWIGKDHIMAFVEIHAEVHFGFLS
jgi:hypothetical protein